MSHAGRSSASPDADRARYIFSLPAAPAFEGQGLKGFAFAPLRHPQLDIHFVDVTRGHDTYMISERITRIYYVLEGQGYFTIENTKYDVRPRMLIEVPPNLRYSYSGTMKLLLIGTPRWFKGNERVTNKNPDVCAGSVRDAVRSLLTLRLFGKSPVGAFLGLNGWLWRRLPSWLTTLGLIRVYGAALHALARLQPRRQSFGTYFLRNRPELDLLTRLADRTGDGSPVRIAIVGCSIGAEAYSVVWALRSARPDLKVVVHAIDVSPAALAFAEHGVYPLGSCEFHDPSIFERLTGDELEEMFERDEASLRIRPWLRDGIFWHPADAGDPDLPDVLGQHDIVVANRFLCHMNPLDAERCLHNVARLVTAGGHIFVSGVDLDVRTKVARALGWKPVSDALEAIHDGDSSLRLQWPCGYTGLEPLDTTRAGWRFRYASVFQV